MRSTSDVIDASVALCAHEYDAQLLTSDPADMAHLIPTLRIIAV
jgi:hypothetical protein